MQNQSCGQGAAANILLSQTHGGVFASGFVTLLGVADQHEMLHVTMHGMTGFAGCCTVLYLYVTLLMSVCAVL